MRGIGNENLKEILKNYDGAWETILLTHTLLTPLSPVTIINKKTSLCRQSYVALNSIRFNATLLMVKQ